jgi:hypothetical protein
MAEMTIRLRVDPETGKKDIVVSLRSDQDSLPHEHEQQHRQLVEKLIEGGMISEGEIGNLIIEREEEEDILSGPIGSSDQQERNSEAEGN